MPFSEYLTIPAVNKSALAYMADSSAACLIALQGRIQKDSTGFAMGSAVDDLLGGMPYEEFEAAYPVASTCQAVIESKKSKRCGQVCGCETKSKYAGQWLCGTHAPEGIEAIEARLTARELQAVDGMVRSAWSSNCKLLLEGKIASQLTILWIDQETGLCCKARPDGVSKCQLPEWETKKNTFFDWKTTKTMSPHSFKRDANDFAYYLQQSHYLSACQALDSAAGREEIERGFVFGVIQNTPEVTGEHVSYLFEYDEATHRKAIAERSFLMRKLKSCIDSGVWPEKKIEGVIVGDTPDYIFSHLKENQ